MPAYRRSDSAGKFVPSFVYGETQVGLVSGAMSGGRRLLLAVSSVLMGCLHALPACLISSRVVVFAGGVRVSTHAELSRL